jgi:hypothetical protein
VNVFRWKYYTEKINEEFFPGLYSYILDNPNKFIFYNMEEISIELDWTLDKTIDIKCVKFVPVKNSNNERKEYINLIKILDFRNTFSELTQNINSSYTNADLFQK